MTKHLNLDLFKSKVHLFFEEKFLVVFGDLMGEL